MKAGRPFCGNEGQGSIGSARLPLCLSVCLINAVLRRAIVVLSVIVHLCLARALFSSLQRYFFLFQESNPFINKVSYSQGISQFGFH